MIKYIKTLTVIVLLAISVSTVHAQANGKKNIFGVFAGGVLSNISDYAGKTRLGLIGGLYWEFRLSKNFSLISNILYSQRGENGKNELPDIKLTYLNMPLMIKYNLLNNFCVSTGINSDFLLSVDGNGGDKDDFKKSDWGIPVGISYDISNNLQLGLIYNLGLTNITKNNNSKLKNNWGSISLAYLFK